MIRFLIFIMLLCAPVLSEAQQKGRIEVLDADAFEVKTQHIKAELIDVRTRAEFAEGHLKGARNIDWNGTDFKAEVKKFPLYQPVFLYCAGGFRSKEAAEWMQQFGFLNIIVLEDGYDHWKELGKQVTIPSAETQKPKPE